MVEKDFLIELRTYWTTVATALSWVWSDDPEPDGLDAQWLRVMVRPEGNARKGVGRAREEARGLIMVEVKTPRKNGIGPGERTSSVVAQLWRDFRHARIQLDAPSVVGLSADGAFNRHLVTLGYRGDMRFVA